MDDVFISFGLEHSFVADVCISEFLDTKWCGHLLPCYVILTRKNNMYNKARCCATLKDKLEDLEQKSEESRVKQLEEIEKLEDRQWRDLCSCSMFVEHEQSVGHSFITFWIHDSSIFWLILLLGTLAGLGEMPLLTYFATGDFGWFEYDVTCILLVLVGRMILTFKTL